MRLGPAVMNLRRSSDSTVESLYAAVEEEFRSSSTSFAAAPPPGAALSMRCAGKFLNRQADGTRPLAEAGVQCRTVVELFWSY